MKVPKETEVECRWASEDTNNLGTFRCIITEMNVRSHLGVCWIIRDCRASNPTLQGASLPLRKLKNLRTMEIRSDRPRHMT